MQNPAYAIATIAYFIAVQMDLPENEFVLANINAVGFYRVQYGADLWTMIVDYLIMNNHTVSQSLKLIYAPAAVSDQLNACGI